jgi:ketosteroid isomerase-like protein
MNEKIDPVLQVIESYKEAVLTKNIDSFCDLYDTDVHIFDMWGKWSIRGIKAWRSMAQGWFSSLGTEHVIVEARNIESVVTGEMAIGHAIFTYTAVSAKGENLRSLDNRITIALKYNGVDWKIIHEHTSAPINHGSLKADLKYADSN